MPQHKTDMDPIEIRVSLIRAGIPQQAIANKLNVSASAIARIIDGDSASHRIRQAIADAINIDIRNIWPSTYIIHGGPRKPGRPKTTEDPAFG